MQEALFENFNKVNSVDIEQIEKYRELLPIELIDIWGKHGYGMLMNGNLKIINPDDYKGVVELSYFRGSNSIPIFATGFGDIITWEKNEYIGIIKYKNGSFDLIVKSMKHLLNCLTDDYFVEKYFEQTKFEEATKVHGNLKFDECFGYAPLPGLGGNEKKENLRIVKIREQIELILQLVGKIGT